MKSPQISRKPLPFLTDRVSHLTKKSSSRSAGFMITGWTRKVASHFMYKKKSSTSTIKQFNTSVSPYYEGLLPGTSSKAHDPTYFTTNYFESLNIPSPYYKGLLYMTETKASSENEGSVFNTSVEDKRHPTSPYYKGLLYSEEVLVSDEQKVTKLNNSVEDKMYRISSYYKELRSYEVESTNPMTRDFRNLSFWSPNYKGRLYDGMEVTILNNSVEDNRYHISPNYKGLIFTKNVCGASSKVERTNPTSHDLQSLSLWSPNYKGLIYNEMVPGEKEAKVTVLSTSVEDTRYHISPNYKELLFTKIVCGASPELESTNPTTHDFQNLRLWSPNDKELIYGEMEVPSVNDVMGT